MRTTRLATVPAAALLGTAMLLTPGATAAATTTPAPADVSSQHVGRLSHTASDPAQDVLPVVADALWAMGGTEGFAGQVLDTDHRTITVHWKGDAPAQVRSYVRARPLGVTVRLVEGARYSRAESLRAAQRLAEPALAAQLGIESVAVSPDGSGVTARVLGTARAAVARSSIASAAAGTTVTFEPAETDVADVAGTRSDDAPAWKGGARTRQNRSLCSTAFAVLKGSAGRLLSANHCNPMANAVVTDGAGQVIAPGGASVAGISSIDSQLIDPSASPATTGRVYTGRWNSGTTAAVKGWASNWTGQRVCGSGATSGQHCGTITNDATTVPGTSGTFYVEVRAAAGQTMVAGGDSGGPVFATVSGGVQARGVILTGAREVACGRTSPDVDSPVCYQHMRYAPISVVLRTWGVALELG